MFIICLLLWLLFNGRITWEILAFGIAVSAAVTWLYRRLTGVTRETERRLARKIPGFFRLLAMLLREVFLPGSRDCAKHFPYIPFEDHTGFFFFLIVRT